MANNRMRFVGVDDNGKIKKELYFAKHFGGAWSHVSYGDFRKNLNEFFDDCFIEHLGVGLTDEYEDKPLTVVYHYNDREEPNIYDRASTLAALVRKMYLTWKRLDLEGDWPDSGHNGWKTFTAWLKALEIDTECDNG